MNRGLIIGLLFPLIVCAMENGLSINVVGKQLDIIDILHNKQKKPAEKMELLHTKIALYLQQKRDNGCNMFFYNGLAALLNDAACEHLERKNRGTVLRDYWADGKKYEQSVILKVYTN